MRTSPLFTPHSVSVRIVMDVKPRPSAAFLFFSWDVRGAIAFPFEGKVPRERRMRWPHFIQNSAESRLKSPFLAKKLQIRSGDTSSVDFVDSFPSSKR